MHDVLSVTYYWLTNDGKAVAFALYFSFVIEERGRHPRETHGKLVFLPAVDLPDEDAIALLLRAFCGIEVKAPEPSWVKDVSLPGEELLDPEEGRLNRELSRVNEEIRQTTNRRAIIRESLELIYQRHKALEPVVRREIGKLGATVHEPVVEGKDDGTVEVIAHGKTYHGVLEIKHTGRPHFKRDDLRQLSEWVTDQDIKGVADCKGIFIASNQVDSMPADRSEPFDPNCLKFAKGQELVIISVKELLAAAVLIHLKHLDPEDFWRDAFETVGRLDCDQYVLRLRDDKPDLASFLFGE